MDIQLRLHSGMFTVEVLNTRYVENRSGLIARMHSHPVYHLMYITRGKGTFHIDGQSTEAAEGRLYIISPHQPHQFQGSPDEPLGNYESTFVLLDEEGKPGGCCLIDLMEEYLGRRLPETARSSPLAIPEAFRPFLVGGFEQLIEQQRGTFTDLRGKLQLLELLLRIFDIVNRIGSSPAGPQSHSLLGELRKFIRANLHRSLTLEEMAGHIHVSPNYLCRLFKRETNLTLHDYLLRLRIEKALKLLLYTDEPVYAIAGQLGFESASYFSRVFRSEQGMSPTEFRRRERKRRSMPHKEDNFLS